MNRKYQVQILWLKMLPRDTPRIGMMISLLDWMAEIEHTWCTETCFVPYTLIPFAIMENMTNSLCHHFCNMHLKVAKESSCSLGHPKRQTMQTADRRLCRPSTFVFILVFVFTLDTYFFASGHKLVLNYIGEFFNVQAELHWVTKVVETHLGNDAFRYLSILFYFICI